MLGVVIAFQNYIPSLGFFKSPFVGLGNFKTLFTNPAFLNVLFNTVYISSMKIVSCLFVQIAFSLLLNEIRLSVVKRTCRLSSICHTLFHGFIMAGIITDILSPTNGLVNQFLGNFGIKPIFFLGNSALFPYVIVVTNVWKEFGWGTIIFLAALSSIDPTIYEAAIIDALAVKQMLHVTLPGVAPTIVLVATLSLGNVLNAGFDQIFNLLSSLTLKTGDIIDTLVYRYGIQTRSLAWPPPRAYSNRRYHAS
jgi:putative aldouronate transport system permease protein